MNGFVWYGTASSTFNCFQMPVEDSNQRQQWEVNNAFGQKKQEKSMLVKSDQVMKIRGQPKIVDKHIMNNKRFALTVNEKKTVQLWKLDDLEMVKEYPAGSDFNQVKEELRQHDMQHSKEQPLPQTWMSLDIKLGCLTLHMEDTNWLKGVVDDKKSNITRKIGGLIMDGGTPNVQSAQQQALIEEEKAEEGQQPIVPVNLGQRVLLKIMGP